MPTMTMKGMITTKPWKMKYESQKKKIKIESIEHHQIYCYFHFKLIDCHSHQNKEEVKSTFKSLILERRSFYIMEEIERFGQGKFDNF